MVIGVSSSRTSTSARASRQGQAGKGSARVPELDSPSPKNTRASPSSTLPPPKRVKGPLNPDLPGLVSGPDSGDEDVLPQIGHRPDELEAELERLMDEQDQEGDVMDADD